MSVETHATPITQTVYMVTCAWGEWHLRALLDLNLPSLLAPKNIPSFINDHRLIYHIHTREQDLSLFEESYSFKVLRSLFDVEFHILDADDLRNPIEAHHQAWLKTTELAQNEGSYVLFMPPDVIWSDSAFSHLSMLLSKDIPGIQMNYMRVIYEPFREMLLESQKPDDEVISIAPRELVRMSFEYLHPLMAAYFHDSKFFPNHAEMHFWPVKNEGVLLRNLAREMFLFNPSKVPVNKFLLLADNFDPRAIHMIDDSDDLFAISFAEFGKDATWHELRQPLDHTSLALWWLDYDSPANRFIASIPIKWHWTDISSEWPLVERKSSFFLRRLDAVSRIVFLWDFFRGRKNRNAAQLVALSILFKLAEDLLPRFDLACVVAPSEEEAVNILRSLDGFNPRRARHALLKALQPYIIVRSAIQTNGIIDTIKDTQYNLDLSGTIENTLDLSNVTACRVNEIIVILRN